MRSILAVAVVVGALHAGPVKVVPAKDWTGIGKTDKLADEAPKSGLITDAKTFEKVWKAWRGAEELPKIDFEKQFVVVTLSRGGPNRPRISATLDEGALKIMSISTLIGGDGFGYSLAVFDRKGVKTVGAEKLP